MNFFNVLYDAGLGYSSINIARAALSCLGLMFDNVLVGKHPIVIRYLKGVYNLRPVTTKNSFVWDVSVVLQYLRKLSPVHMLCLKQLSFKLVMLIALTNATRSQTIHLLRIDNMQKLPGEYVFTIFDLLKQSRPGYKNPRVILKAYPPDRRLCVYTVLKEYLKRTKVFHNNHKNLILSYIEPHKPVTCSTISRWIKTVMSKSGIDVKQYSAHSVRSAAVSKAKINCVPIKDILAKGGWSNAGTFAKFYDKDLKNQVDFSVSVLNDN